jgi:GH35 family endo-1,4-beta-xylanase
VRRAVAALAGALPALLAALAGALLAPAAASTASAAPVAIRGIEAEQLEGSFRVVLLPGASGGKAIALGPGAEAHARVDLLATRRVEVTLAAGCAPGTAVLLALGRRHVRLAAGARALHVTGFDVRLPAGERSLALRAAIRARARRRCAAPVVDRIDFLPASRAGAVLLGAAMGAASLELNPTYRSLFLAHFDSLTPENELKMAYVEPRQGHFDFGPADELIDFAEAHGKQVRGHTLIYGQQLPGWVAHPLLPWSRSSLLSVMQAYIDTVMHRYASAVGVWDVVNEAFDSDGDYRRNVFYDVLGPSYIADAFRFAHAADPQAQLFYNDDDLVESAAKADAVVAMVRGLQTAGVEIDGIGLEDHTFVPAYPSEDELQETLARFAALGLRVEITEMSVGIQYLPGTLAEREQAQAQAYRADATACWEIAACQRLTTWGVYDGLSWSQDGAAPLLFAADYSPKPAFYAVEQALHRGPWAR